MDPAQDPYDVLGLVSTATQDEVRSAHRRLVKVLHPDTGGSRVLFEVVQQAYLALDSSSARATPASAVAAFDQPLPCPSCVRRARPRPALWVRRTRHQRVVESLLAAQLSVGGVGLLTILAQT